MELASFRRGDKYRLAARFPNFANWLLFLGIGMAATGFPLLMAFDPLTILSGFLSAWQWRNLEWSVLVPAIPFLGLILLNIIRPNLWCRRLCPLGAAQHFLGMAGRRFYPRRAGELQTSFSSSGINRRFFLLTLLGGIVGLILMPKKSLAVLSFVRPPGSVNENIFTGLCARCGHCINVCPENIIVPDLGSSGIRGFLTPILKFRGNYCNEWCSKCVDSCPTAAIRRISLEQKRLTAIGTSRINKSLCLAWTCKQDCLVCQEFCPYQAIAIVKNGGVNCPEVNEALCRGCGACQSQCPAIPDKAITVHGLPSQKKITAE